MKPAKLGFVLTVVGLLILAGIFVGCRTASAQDTFTGPPTPHVALWGQTPLGTHPDEAAAAPALTELELALIENVNLLTELRKLQLEADTCRGQLAQPRADATAQQVTDRLTAIKARVAASHPGYDWDPASGKFTPKPKEGKK